MVVSSIPIVDLSHFLGENLEEDGKRETIQAITKACTEDGFFLIRNHCVPLTLMTRALELSKIYFGYPDEEKLTPPSTTPFPVGYGRQPANSPDKNEFFLMFSPDQCSFDNVYPQNPPEFRDIVEELFNHLSKTGLLMESILSECMDLHPSFLREFNSDRSCDFMSTKHYFPATETENMGITEHEDGSCFTFVLQDDVGGLEVKKDGKWVPISPAEGTIVVNIGDVIQVLSNNKFKSATHRVVRPKDKSRYSYAFFYTLQGDKWVEPLSQFTIEIGEAPKYRGFFYKDYLALRLRNKTHPPERPEDVIHITHYAITT